MWTMDGETKDKTREPYQKGEVLREAAADVVTDTQLSRGDGWHL